MGSVPGTGKAAASPEIGEALAALDVRRLVLAIHDVSFPAAPDEDVGRGTPYGAGAQGVFALAAGLGFNAIQLGPQGQTSLVNPSPYDGMLFSRCFLDVALRELATDPRWGGILRSETVAAAVKGRPREGE